MKISFFILLFTFSIFDLYAQKNITCSIKTEMGNITIELYPSKAPVTVANFLQYVDSGLYNGSSFFRAVTLINQPKDSVKIEVIQGGDVDSLKGFAPIPLETTASTGLRHRHGTVSMARGKPATATSSFFICINDQPELDFGGKRNKDGQGFAAFGKVIKGMEIVQRIQQLYPDQGQYFKPPVHIISITRN
ncbi:MAG TPA: peptidylprolyl isomerase [Ferruginibacter sp.]|jgi:peptidyl-prolyl cis-trans isomerase A (cyclophilin A)|nr:peptidylprolyl isomerase [Ferruginibacter sp.]